MDDAKKKELIEQLKTKLRITWDNKKTNTELSDLVDDTESYMNHILGTEVDYSVPGIMRRLFLAYASYVWNDCEDEFEDAYKKEILKARAICEVKENEEEARTSE